MARFRLALFILGLLGMPFDEVEKRMRIQGDLERRRELLRDNIGRFDAIRESRGLAPIVERIADGYVYFILNKRRGVVKIGNSKRPQNRVVDLQVSSADPLILLGAIEGTKELEKRLHGIFSQYWVSGEWFRYESDVKQYISAQLERAGS